VMASEPSSVATFPTRVEEGIVLVNLPVERTTRDSKLSDSK